MLQAAHWMAFLAYGGAAVALGVSAGRRTGHGRAFWDAGRSLNAASVGMSISAGFLSVSWSCVYAVQLFYGYGLGALWLITLPWLLALGGIYLLADRYRRLRAFSQPEMVGARFGRAARRQVAAALAFVFLVWGGAEIYVAATLLAPGLGVSRPATILLIGALVAAYSVTGGFGAVVATDRLQYALVASYLLAVAVLAGVALAGLPAANMAGAAPAGWRALARDLPPPLHGGARWSDLWAPGLATILLTFVAYLPGWLFETDLWLRVQAARDRAAARRGVLFAAANAVVFVGLVPAFVGVAALALYPPAGGSAPASVGADGEAILAALVHDTAPAWLAVLLAVGLVAAAMSTIDTCTHVMGLSVAYDMLDGSARAGGDRLARLTTLLAVAAACVFALGTESLWDIFYLSSGVLTTAVALPVAAVLARRPTARCVRTSSSWGLAVTALAYFLERYGPLAALEPAAVAASGLGFILWGTLAALAGAAVGQRLTPACETSAASGRS